MPCCWGAKAYRCFNFSVCSSLLSDVDRSGYQPLFLEDEQGGGADGDIDEHPQSDHPVDMELLNEAEEIAAARKEADDDRAAAEADAKAVVAAEER